MENLLIDEIIDSFKSQNPANKQVLKYELENHKKDKRITLPFGNLKQVCTSQGKDKLLKETSFGVAN